MRKKEKNNLIDLTILMIGISSLTLLFLGIIFKYLPIIISSGILFVIREEIIYHSWIKPMIKKKLK